MTWLTSHIDTCIYDVTWLTLYLLREVHIYIQPIVYRVAQHLEIVSKTFPTNQYSAHGIYDWYQVINDESHENPGTPGTKLKVLRNNLEMLCHPICNWLYLHMYLSCDMTHTCIWCVRYIYTHIHMHLMCDVTHISHRYMYLWCDMTHSVPIAWHISIHT